MDKFIKNAAIYLTVKSEKEDSYFISQKIKKMKECCKREDIEVIHIFVMFKNGQRDFNANKRKYLMEQIKKNQIQVLIIEESETIIQLETVEVEKVMIQ